MEVFSLGIEAVWSAQRYSRELADSVWSVCFYEHLLDVLVNDTWRSYHSEAFSRPCRFETLQEFLTHKDGLGWPAVPEILEMIQIVSQCNPAPPPRLNEPIDHPITEWANEALKELKQCGVERLETAPRHAARALAITSEFAEPGDNQHSIKEVGGDNVTTYRANETSKGNSAAYLAARLKKAGRDDLLKQIGLGKTFTSMRAAAIEAGIIKPVPTVRLVADMSVVARKLCQHLTQQQRLELIDLLAPDL